MSDNVCINADDGGVCIPHPGEAVAGELPDLTGKVDRLALPHCQIHHPGLAQPTEVRPLVEPRMLPCVRNMMVVQLRWVWLDFKLSKITFYV